MSETSQTLPHESTFQQAHVVPAASALPGIAPEAVSETGSQNPNQAANQAPDQTPDQAANQALNQAPDQALNQAPNQALNQAPGPPRRSGPPGRSPSLVFPGLLDTVCSLLSIVAVAVFVLTFIVQPFRIPSESMERTLLVGDFLLVNKAIYAPGGIWSHVLPYKPIERGDIVVFHFPLDPEDHVVKRVIGLPGDRIRLNHARVFVNGEAVDEPYVVYEASYPDNFRDNFPAKLYTDPGVDTHWWMQMRHDVKNGELVVPPEMYFVLGDNRNHSRDSRYWGFVPRENIVGRPFIIYFSLWQQSSTDIHPLPDDRLGSDNDKWDHLSTFARWDRMFRVVR